MTYQNGVWYIQRSSFLRNGPFLHACFSRIWQNILFWLKGALLGIFWEHIPGSFIKFCGGEFSSDRNELTYQNGVWYIHRSNFLRNGPYLHACFSRIWQNILFWLKGALLGIFWEHIPGSFIIFCGGEFSSEWNELAYQNGVWHVHISHFRRNGPFILACFSRIWKNILFWLKGALLGISWEHIPGSFIIFCGGEFPSDRN